MSVFPQGATPPQIRRIYTKFDINVFSENLLRIFEFYESMTRMTGIPHSCLRTFVKVFRSILLGMRDFQTKIVAKFKTHIFCSVTFVFQNRAFKRKCGNSWYSRKTWKQLIQPENVETVDTAGKRGNSWYSRKMWKQLIQPENVETVDTAGKCGNSWYSRKTWKQLI